MIIRGDLCIILYKFKYLNRNTTMAKRALSARIGGPLLALLLAGTVGTGLLGCEDAAQEDATPDQPQAQAGEVRSEKQRVANPDVSQQQRDALVSGNTAFALDLYNQTASKHKNIFSPPFSTPEARAMTYAGARGETAAQMADTLHLSADPDQVHPTFNWLDAHLMNLGEV